MIRYPEGLKFDLHDRAQMDQQHLSTFLENMQRNVPTPTKQHDHLDHLVHGRDETLQQKQERRAQHMGSCGICCHSKVQHLLH